MPKTPWPIITKKVGTQKILPSLGVSWTMISSIVRSSLSLLSFTKMPTATLVRPSTTESLPASTGQRQKIIAKIRAKGTSIAHHTVQTLRTHPQNIIRRNVQILTQRLRQMRLGWQSQSARIASPRCCPPACWPRWW